MVGYILKPQGIRGEVKVEPVSSDPARFNRLKKIFLNTTAVKAYAVEAVRVSERFVYLKLGGVDTRNEAETLRGAEILIPEEDLVDLGDNEYFVHDLIGCRVVDEQNRAVGELIDIMQNTSNDIYVLSTMDGRELLIPAIRDVVRDIDVGAKIITIRILNGLLD